MKKLILLSILIMANYCIKGQIQVYSNNYVGIKTTAANSPLSINTTGNSDYAVSIAIASGNTGGLLFSNSSPASSTNWGIVSSLSNTNSKIIRSIYGSAYSSSVVGGQAYGVHGISGNSTDGYNVGVFGQLQGSKKGTAVYGLVGTGYPSAPNAQYAGYFYGDVKVIGTLWVNSTPYTSDENLKKNISVIDSTDKIFSLNPVKYNLKSISELTDTTATKSDTLKTPAPTLPDPEYVKKLHYGFLAQDLQQVYPDLVYQDGDGTLGIDYQGLIPIIIDQLKKMKQSLDEKDARIAALELKIQQLEKKK